MIATSKITVTKAAASRRTRRTALGRHSTQTAAGGMQWNAITLISGSSSGREMITLSLRRSRTAHRPLTLRIGGLRLRCFRARRRAISRPTSERIISFSTSRSVATGRALHPSTAVLAVREPVSVSQCSYFFLYKIQLINPADYVNNNPSAFENAYWEINSLRVYT